MTAFRHGARLAVSFLSVLPVRAGRVDRATAAVAMALAPAVGVLLGGLAALVAYAAAALGAGALLAAVLSVGTLAVLTRGLHLDGLADTADGLGSGLAPGPAQEVMRRSDVGPFGVVTLLLVILTQVSAVAELIEAGSAAAGLVVAAATGRAAVTVGCRRGVPSARPDGLGALVAGSLPVAAAGAVAALLVVGAAAVGAVDRRLALAPVGVVAGLLAALVLERHAVRRLSGVTGDVLGALVETGTTAALVVLALG